MLRKVSIAALCATGLVAGAVPAAAQGLEAFGSRATALAAFVAVADDASAVAWNPSGLVSGPIFNLQIDLGRSTHRQEEALLPGTAADRFQALLVAIGTTPAGLSYYRLVSSSFLVDDPAASGSPDREKEQVQIRTLVTSHLGVTVQQSLGEYVTLGATLKLVRGSVGTGTVEASSWNEAFDSVDALAREGSTRGDLDVGAMFAAGRMRAGLVVRNVTAPSFGAEDSTLRLGLERHARIGVAWGDGWPGLSPTIVAVDADLTRVPYAAGERRDIAAGVERWIANRRVGLRGGARASTVGDTRVVWSGGASYALRTGMYVDAFVAGGRVDERSWGLAARLSF
jgi:hypothetical protein